MLPHRKGRCSAGPKDCHREPEPAARCTARDWWKHCPTQNSILAAGLLSLAVSANPLCVIRGIRPRFCCSPVLRCARQTRLHCKTGNLTTKVALPDAPFLVSSPAPPSVSLDSRFRSYKYTIGRASGNLRKTSARPHWP